MKSVTAKDLGNRSSKLWGDLRREGEMVVTDNGEPVAILTATDADSLEESLRRLRQSRTVDTLNKLQREAERRGLDESTFDDINDEIRAFRKLRKTG